MGTNLIRDAWRGDESISAVHKLQNGSKRLTVGGIGFLVDINGGVEPARILVYQVADNHSVETVERQLAVAAGANVNKVRSFTGTMTRATIFLARASVSGALALE